MATKRLVGVSALIVSLSACGGAQPPGTEQPKDGLVRVPDEPVDSAADSQGGEGARLASKPDAAERKERDGDDETAAPKVVARAKPPTGAPPAWLSAPMPPYQAGALLKHLPRDCAGERVYVNVAGIVGQDGQLVRRLVDHFAGAASNQERKLYGAVLALAKDAGVDPFTAVREIAACDAEDDIAVVGVATSRPVELPIFFQKVMQAVGEDPGQVERHGDVSLLVDGSDAAAQIGPTVVVFGDKKDAVLASAKSNTPAASFANASKHLVFVATKEADVTVTEKGGNLEVRMTGRVRQGSTETSKQRADRIRKDLDQVAKALAGTPLKTLAERLRAVKVTVQGANIVITGSIARADLSAMLSTAASMTPEQLMRALKEG